MTTEPPVRLHDGDLSALYRSADATSGAGQRRTRLLVGTELVGLVAAAAAGVTTWRVGDGRYDLLAVVAAAGFALALGCTVIRHRTRPEESWYAGRAGAESARTLGWRYAVGGAPFAVGEPARATDDRFLDRLREVVGELADTGLRPPASGDREITPAMRQLREQDLATRRCVYEHDRIGDQLDWYRRRTATHARSARRWTGLVVAAAALGVAAAVLEFFVLDVDLLGVCAAAAAAAVAGNQLGQHRTLAAAYALTAAELDIIRERITHVPDAEWADFVSDAEGAISREHTMWLARHGHVPRSVRG